MPASAPLWPLIAKRPFPRIHVLSDVHLEHGPYEIPDTLDFDILVAAGDIGRVDRAVEWLAGVGKPVIYTLGNHEHWGCDHDEVFKAARKAARGTRVHVLERKQAVLCGVRFLGATLWTNYGDWNAALVANAQSMMRDHSEVRAGDWYGKASNRKWLHRCLRRIGISPAQDEHAAESREFHPAIAYQLHLRSVRWLERALARPFAGPTVVVTHHAPTFASLRALGIHESLLDPKNWTYYRDNDLVRVASYASSLDTLLDKHRRKIALWVHGHLHCAIDVVASGVRVLCNPRGRWIPPLNESSAEAFRLFGVSVTEQDIADSRAAHRENPFMGDGRDFDALHIVDVERGLEQPIRSALDAPLAEMRDIARRVSKMVPYLLGPEDIPGDCVHRCFEHDTERFRNLIGSIRNDICRGLHPRFGTYALEATKAPSTLPTVPMVDLFDNSAPTESDYLAVVQAMRAWCRWVLRLPRAPQRALATWARVGLDCLAALQKKGIVARVGMPEAHALRVIIEPRFDIYVVGDERVVAAAKSHVDALFGARKGLPRFYALVLGTAHASDKNGARLLSLRQLERWARS